MVTNGSARTQNADMPCKHCLTCGHALLHPCPLPRHDRLRLARGRTVRCARRSLPLAGGRQRPKALEWARARNAESAAALETRSFAATERRILDIFDSNARIPQVVKLGRYYYNFWQDAKNPRGVWRRTTMEEYRKREPAWDKVLDLDALNVPRKRTGFGRARPACGREYRRCLIALSRGGADANVVREFDLEAKTFVKDGFSLPEAKSGAKWRDADSIYVETDFGPGSMTAPATRASQSYGSAARRSPTRARSTRPRSTTSASRPGATTRKAIERDFVVRRIAFYTNELFLLRDGRLIRIDKPDSADATAHRDLLLIELRDAWTIGGTTYPRGALLAADFERFLAGERNSRVLFAPGERKALAGFSPTRNRIIVNELDNVRNRVVVLARAGAKWTRTPLRGLPELSTVDVRAVDADESDDYFADGHGISPAERSVPRHRRRRRAREARSSFPHSSTQKDSQ